MWFFNGRKKKLDLFEKELEEKNRNLIILEKKLKNKENQFKKSGNRIVMDRVVRIDDYFQVKQQEFKDQFKVLVKSVFELNLPIIEDCIETANNDTLCIFLSNLENIRKIIEQELFKRL